MNDKLIYIFGLRRCGNHAIINWLHGHVDNSEHFNNQKLSKDLLWKPKTVAPRELVTISFEEYPLKKDNLITNISEIGNINRQIECVIIRDPFNMFASRFKHKNLRKQTIAKKQYFINQWKSYAKEYLGETHVFNNLVPVNYNKWFTDEDYRKKLSLDFNFSTTSSEINKVSQKGHGSSFDGLKFDGKAQKMKTLERWKDFAKDKEYRSIFKDAEIVDLSNKIFGTIPGTECIYE